MILIEEGNTREALENKIEEMVDKKLHGAMNEVGVKEKRKLNIIVSNLPESTGDKPEERKREDVERVCKLIKKSLCDGKPVDNPAHLGQIQVGKNSKPRLLKLTVMNEETKEK